MPGTDICLKIGGWVRAEITDPTNGNLTAGNYTANAQQRQTNNLTDRARGYITADARNQTEYGTVRSYIAVGLSTTDFGNSPGPRRDLLEPCLHPVGGHHCRYCPVVL